MPKSNSEVREFEERMSKLTTDERLAAYARIDAQKDFDTMSHQREEERLGHYDDDYLQAEQDGIDSCG